MKNLCALLWEGAFSLPLVSNGANGGTDLQLFSCEVQKEVLQLIWIHDNNILCQKWNQKKRQCLSILMHCYDRYMKEEANLQATCHAWLNVCFPVSISNGASSQLHVFAFMGWADKFIFSLLCKSLAQRVCLIQRLIRLLSGEFVRSYNVQN